MNKIELQEKIEAKRAQVARFRAKEDGTAMIAVSEQRIANYDSEIEQKTEYIEKMTEDINNKIAELQAEIARREDYIARQSSAIDRKIDELKTKKSKEQGKIDKLSEKNPDTAPAVVKAEAELAKMEEIAVYINNLRARLETETDGDMRDFLRGTIELEIAKFKTAKGRAI